MKIDETLSSTFGIAPMKGTEVITADGEIINDKTNKIEDDYEITRNNLRLILQQGQSALMKALDVAHQSEHPRAFEVVGGLVKHLSDVNAQLLDLHKRKQAIEAPAKKEASVTNNNAIFVGSTNDLSKMLNDLRKGK